MNRILKTGLLLVALNGLTLGVSACEDEEDPEVSTNPFPTVDANPYRDGNFFMTADPCVVDVDPACNSFAADASPDTGVYNALPDAGPSDPDPESQTR